MATANWENILKAAAGTLNGEETALTANPAAAPAGGTGTAAGGWDTAVNRDAAIVTINSLRTRLSEVEAILQKFGFVK